ncbi:TPA: type-F conjugative transfer system pilin assembly thiol-disulfide isomerase TrbB [Providencia rettgeri]
MMLAMMLFFSGLVQASVMDDIAELEAHKTAPSERETVIEEETRTTNINTVAVTVKPYRLPNGKVINLNDYTLVLFMQAKCPYCQQFDPQLALLSAQTGFKVFAYTLDGQGDMAFPNAIPAPAEVVQTFFGAGMQVVTPSVFLVEVNTLRTYPLLQGLTDMQDVMNRIHSNLMLVTQ